jgi:hypothetical protein
MNEELLKQAMALFNTPEKWNAFRELVNIDDSIQQKWWKKLQQEVYKRELETANPEWDIFIWDDWGDIRWYIKEWWRDSLCVHFGGDDFRVYAGFGDLDKDKIADLLNNEKFYALKLCFDRVDGSDETTIGWEERNFSFNTIYDGNIPNHQILSWYAGHETEKFADQIIAKVRKFQTPEITALFCEINERCQKE